MTFRGGVNRSSSLCLEASSCTRSACSLCEETARLPSESQALVFCGLERQVLCICDAAYLLRRSKLSSLLCGIQCDGCESAGTCAHHLVAPHAISASMLPSPLVPFQYSTSPHMLRASASNAMSAIACVQIAHHLAPHSMLGRSRLCSDAQLVAEACPAMMHLQCENQPTLPC